MNELTFQERFVNKLLKITLNEGLSANVMAIMKKYYDSIDNALATAESIRQGKTGQYQDKTPVTWQNIDLDKLAPKVVFYSKLLVDPLHDNSIFALPVKNKKADIYEVDLRLGYNGLRFLATKYALTPFINVITELVYSTDKFRVVKKDINNPVENYSLEVTNVFNRGDIVGAFSYIEYENPKSNKLIIMNRADIEKRKPDYASANFWGGTTTKWVNGTKTEAEIDGWSEIMAYKTMLRETFKPRNIPLDSTKVGLETPIKQEQQQQTFNAIADSVQAEIASTANTIALDIVEDEVPESLPPVTEDDDF